MAELEAELDREEQGGTKPRQSATDARLAGIELLASGSALPAAPLPSGAGIRAQDLQTLRLERAATRRQEREAQEGIPERQAEWDTQAAEIYKTRDAAIREAGERCRADERAARERADDELSALGERPTLKEVNV